MVHRRLQLLDQQRHALVPQREVPQRAELCHWRGVWLLLRSLFEVVVAQEVPDTADILVLALDRIDLDRLDLSVHKDLKLLVEVHLAVVHVTEHRVHEAEDTRGVLPQHLVQHFAQTAGRDPNAALRNRVLDGGREDVARRLPRQGAGGARGLRGLADHREVDAAARVEQEHERDQHSHEGEASPSQEELPRLAAAHGLRQRGEFLASAHHPLPTVVQLGVVTGREDCHVGRGQVVRHHKGQAAVLLHSRRHPRRLEKVHERLALAEVQSLGDPVLRHSSARRVGKLQDDQHGLRRIAAMLQVHLPIRELVLGRCDDLGGRVRSRAQRRTRSPDADHGPGHDVDRVVPVDERVLAPVGAIGAHERLPEVRMLVDGGHRGAQAHGSADEHVLLEEALVHPPGGVVAALQNTVGGLLLPPVGQQRCVQRFALRERCEAPAGEAHLRAAVDHRNAVPRQAPCQTDLQAPRIAGILAVDLRQQPWHALRLEGVPCRLQVAARHSVRLPHARGSDRPLLLVVEQLGRLAGGDVPQVLRLGHGEAREEPGRIGIREAASLLDGADGPAGQKPAAVHAAELLGRILVVNDIQLANDVEIVLAEGLRVLPRVGDKVRDEVRGDVVGGVDAETVDVGVRNPILHQVRVHLLEARVHGVKLELLFARVVHPQMPALQGRRVGVVGPEAVEGLAVLVVKAAGAAPREETRVPKRLVQLVTPRELATLRRRKGIAPARIPVRILHVGDTLHDPLRAEV
mmetsp:Transcript_117505/g.339715  ORF Transcript_117505/g.339715 Transcript_117505/m.339715 type:complete len:746 (-) Transcript_117505:888-3125(-)